MKSINEMSNQELCNHMRKNLRGDLGEDIERLLIERIEQLEEFNRWVPVSERLPTKEDANYHDEVLVCLDPWSAVNSPCLETGVEIVYRDEVSPAKHLYWKRADPPDEYHNYH